VFGFKGVFGDNWFSDLVVGGSINYMFFKMGFEGSTTVTYVRFSTRACNLVNSWTEHRVGFIFSGFK
jgi:hypothetical protein